MCSFSCGGWRGAHNGQKEAVIPLDKASQNGADCHLWLADASHTQRDVCVCVRAHSHIHTHTHSYTLIHSYAHTHTHTHTLKLIPTHTHTYTHIHSHLYTHTHICTLTHPETHTLTLTLIHSHSLPLSHMLSGRTTRRTTPGRASHSKIPIVKPQTGSTWQSMCQGLLCIFLSCFSWRLFL